jgi:hypothetical protein
MEERKIILIVVVLAIILISIITVFSLSGMNFILGLDHDITTSSLNELSSSLKTGDKLVAVKTSGTSIWKRGQAGSIGLGIRNKYENDKTFYINMYLEKLGGDLTGMPLSSVRADDWLIYPSQETVEGQNAETVKIIIKPMNPDKGIYLFRILVCESSDCDFKSPGYYSADSFSLEIQ